jgi:hypothetical protein
MDRRVARLQGRSTGKAPRACPPLTAGSHATHVSLNRSRVPLCGVLESHQSRPHHTRSHRTRVVRSTKTHPLRRGACGREETTHLAADPSCRPRLLTSPAQQRRAATRAVGPVRSRGCVRFSALLPAGTATPADRWSSTAKSPSRPPRKALAGHKIPAPFFFFSALDGLLAASR